MHRKYRWEYNYFIWKLLLRWKRFNACFLKKKIQYLVHVGLRSALHSVPLGATKQLNACRWMRLKSYSDARWIKKEKWTINPKAPQEGDCHGNTRAQRKRGAPTLLVTDWTRCTHTSESATNMQFCHQLIQYWQQVRYEGVQVEIRNLVVAVQGKHPGRAWNSHAH